jgi:hypothetical protein
MREDRVHRFTIEIYVLNTQPRSTLNPVCSARIALIRRASRGRHAERGSGRRNVGYNPAQHRSLAWLAADQDERLPAGD